MRDLDPNERARAEIEAVADWLDANSAERRFRHLALGLPPPGYSWDWLKPSIAAWTWPWPLTWAHRETDPGAM